MTMKCQNKNKIIVSVVARTDFEGKVTPQQIILDDGRSFDVKAIEEPQFVLPIHGEGQGWKYRCKIFKEGILVRETYLYFAQYEKIWFLERRGT